MIVTIAKTSSGFQITRIVDGSFTYTLRNRSIFALRVVKLSNRESIDMDASHFSDQYVTELPDGSIKITYYNQTLVPGNVKVHVFCRVGENHEADIRIEVYFRVRGYVLEFSDISYTVNNFTSTGNNNIMAVPQPSHDGLLYRNPGSGLTYSLPYPGPWAAQTYTLFNPVNEQVLYFQTTDKEAWNKELVFFAAGTGTAINNRFYTNEPGELRDSKLPYSIRIKGLTGDLYDSAMKYREWVTGNDPAWLSKGKVYDSGSLHSTASKNQRLGYIQNLTLTPGKDGHQWMVDTLENLQYGLALNRNEQSTIWYDWWGKLYADTTQWPEFPLLTGVNPYTYDLKTAYQSGSTLGYNIVPYTLPFNWDTNELNEEYIKDYPYEAFLVKTIFDTGLTYKEYYESLGINTVDVNDSNNRYWQELIKKEYTRLANDVGFSGFYLDVYRQGSSVNYDPHAPVRGSYPNRIDGWRPTFEAIKQVVGTGGLLFSEYASEKDIGFIDFQTIIRLVDAGSSAFVSRQTPYYSFIYSDYHRHGALPFMERTQDAYNTYLDGYFPTLAIASANVPPTIGNIFSTSTPYAFTYAAMLAAIQVFSIFRNELDPYVRAGQKLRPISGSIAYNGYRDTGAVGTAYTNYNAWMSPTGSMGVIMTNASLFGPENVTIRLPVDKYPFLAQDTTLRVFTGSIYPFTGSGWNSSGTIPAGGYTGTYSIPILDVKLLEFTAI